jgi:hypothetical protein
MTGISARQLPREDGTGTGRQGFRGSIAGSALRGGRP